AARPARRGVAARPRSRTRPRRPPGSGDRPLEGVSRDPPERPGCGRRPRSTRTGRVRRGPVELSAAPSHLPSRRHSRHTIPLRPAPGRRPASLRNRGMPDLHSPKLRPGREVMAGPEPQIVVIIDHFRLGGPFPLSRDAFDLIRLFDGRKTLADVRAESVIMFGEAVPLDALTNLVEALDQEFFLESPRLFDRLTVPDRPPVCIGCYDADPDSARKQLRRLFTATGGPGLPGAPGCRVATEGPVRAVLLPHMDYQRGGVTYGWGFKELVERTDASLFVVIATSHFSGRRFTLTRQNFCSPLGRGETDQAHIDRIVEYFGDGLFDDPFAHAPEHSIELEVVGMQFAFAGRPFRIVPLLVGSFFDCVGARARPGDRPDVAQMVAALGAAEAEAKEP